jgi:hypothetical protein
MNAASRLLLSLVLFSAVLAYAQQPGPNVNVLPSYPNGIFAPPFPPPVTSLTDSLRGDGYLQRQVEPAIAVSTYNPDHILAAFGDFRTTAIPNDQGMPEDSTEGWVGLARSYDRGRTWFGSMVPGFPKDTSSVGQATPLFKAGLQAGTDPAIATTPGGRFYVAGLFFTRDKGSSVAVARYQDIPNTDGGDTIQYQGMNVVAVGSLPLLNTFLDKPALAADVARGTTSASVCGPVYVAWTIFNGQPDTTPFSSRIGFSTSEQGHCGSDWDRAFFISQPFKQNQGTAIAVDPRNGKIYLIWRHVYQAGGDGYPDGIVMVTSTDRGNSFSAPKLITPKSFAPFDQPSIATTTDAIHPTFRSNAFPTIAVDANGNVYVAIQEKTSPSQGGFPTGYYEPRIVLRTSRDGGTTWTQGSVVDAGNGKSAQQFMPTLSFSGGLLRLLWYDFRDQNQLSDNVNSGWWVTGLDRQVKTYVAQSTLSSLDAKNNPAFSPSVPMSLYLTDSGQQNGGPISVPGTTMPAVNRPNLPMYAAGTTPFTGDYIGLAAASPYVPNSGGTTAFRWATQPSDYIAQPMFGVWTDSRDVVFPSSNSGGKPNLYDITGWQTYAPPGSTNSLCVNAGARNANVYFSEVKTGVIAGSPSTSRQLVGGSGAPIERAFPIYVENPNSSEKFFRLSFSGTGVNGSFTQGGEISGNAVTSVDVDILPRSSATLTVYVYCPSCATSAAFAPFSVSVGEIDRLQGNVVPGGATTKVLFNADPTAPFVTNPQLASTEIHNATVSNPQYSNPQYSNPQYSNPQYSNPQYSNPQYSNPQYSNPQYSNIAPPDVAPGQPPVGDFVWTVQNAGNNASAYSSITNVAVAALGPYYTYQTIVARSYNSPSFNGCNVQPIPADQIISVIPNPQYSNPQYSNPQYSNPQYSNPQYSNATFAAVPPPPGTSGASVLTAATTGTSTSSGDGTTKMPRLPDTVYVILRVYRTAIPPGSNVTTVTPLTSSEQTNFLNNVSQIVYSQAANTGSNTPPPPSSNKSFSTTTLAASTNTAGFGTPVTLTATVAPQAPAIATPTGTVTFQEGSTPLSGGQAVSLTNGKAVLNTSTLGVGTHTITAVYSGDSSFNFSLSGTVTLVISGAGTTTTISAQPNPSFVGQTVTFAATVSVVAPATGTPTGTVSFTDSSNNNASLGSATLTNGMASIQISSLTPGTHTVTATYTPDTINYTGSTAGTPVLQAVNALSPTTTVITSDSPNNTSVWGQKVTFTATVTPTPTGTVAFYLDTVSPQGSPAATVPLANGQATFAPVPRLDLTTGQSTTTHSVIAVYMPDLASTGLAGSTSQPFTQTVNNYIQLFSATNVTASPNNGALVDPFSNLGAVTVFGTKTISTGCSAMTAIVAGSADQHAGFVVDNYVTVNAPANVYGNNICTGPHSDTFNEGSVFSCFQGVTSSGTPTQISDYIAEPPITLTGAPLNLAPTYGTWVTNTFAMDDIGVVYTSSDLYLVVTNCQVPQAPPQP